MMRRGWTGRNDTRLRREPDHGAEVLRLLPARTEVEVLEEQARFTKVRLQDDYSDLTGYIAKGFLDIEPAEVSESELEPRPDYLLPCPRCGTKNWGKFPLQQSGGHGFSQNFYIPTGFLAGVDVLARVCLRCGYLELCVEEENLSALHRLRRESRER